MSTDLESMTMKVTLPPLPSNPPDSHLPSFDDAASSTSAAVLSHLRRLARGRRWRTVAERTSDLLFGATSSYHPLLGLLTGRDAPSASAPPDTDGYRGLRAEFAEILLLRLTALVQLGRYSECLSECGTAGLLPPGPGDVDLFLSRRPAWIPLGLTVVACELTGLRDARECADALGALRGGLERLHQRRDPGEHVPPRRWIGRIDEALANVHARAGKHRLALGVLQTLVGDSTAHAAEWAAEARGAAGAEDGAPGWDGVADAAAGAARAELYGRAGRIFLQVGAGPAAEAAFSRAKTEWAGAEAAGAHAAATCPEAERALQSVDAYEHGAAGVVCDAALLLFSQRRYEEAGARFAEAAGEEAAAVEAAGGLEREGAPAKTAGLLDQSASLRSRSFSEDANRKLLNQSASFAAGTPPSFCLPAALYPGIGVSVPESPEACSLDNVGLCALYRCQLSDAVRRLEGMIEADPIRYMTQVLVFNLCTLYDLSNDQEGSAASKRRLVELAKNLDLHDVGTEVFRIGT